MRTLIPLLYNHSLDATSYIIVCGQLIEHIRICMYYPILKMPEIYFIHRKKSKMKRKIISKSYKEKVEQENPPHVFRVFPCPFIAHSSSVNVHLTESVVEIQ